MAVHYLPPPTITDRPTLVRFAAEAWLLQLYANRVGVDAVGTTDNLLAEVAPSQQRQQAGAAGDVDRGHGLRSDLHKGLLALKNLERVSRQTKQSQIRDLLRHLDGHLARKHSDKHIHLLSFYDSTEPSSAATQEWMDTQSFAAAWAAGPTRSKHEVLSRGAKAARLSQELGDGFTKFLTDPARPSDPYLSEPVTLKELVEQTCDELIGVASLPPNSGAAAAIRHLASIGEIALKQVERAIYGGAGGTPSALAWRLARVLTRIGEIVDARVAEEVWGRDRAHTVVTTAKGLLLRLIDQPQPTINSARSLLVEAFRYLDPAGPVSRAHVKARLQSGRAVGSIDPADDGKLSTREIEYTAFALAQSNPGELDEIVGLTLAAGAEEQAARGYAAVYISMINDANPHGPDLSKRWVASSPEGKKWTCTAKRLKLAPTLVTSPHDLVWKALESIVDNHTSADPSSNPWRRSDSVSKLQKSSDKPADKLLRLIAINAREALRSLVAQAVLTIDGTARREAIEAIRQAGFDDVAAKLFSVIAKELERVRTERKDDGVWEFDWLLDHAVFCMSYTGSTATEPYEHLLELAGLTEDLKKHLHPSRARLRTTALLGLADLSDVLHDDDSVAGKARLTDLLASVETRLRSLQLTRPCVEKDDLEWLPDSEELRALTAVVAMLRLPETKSIRLLHILSGRCYETTAGSTTVSNKSEYARCRPPQLVGDAAVKEGRRRYSPQTDPAWGNWPKVWQPLLHWDLVTWQLAEWGLIRVERRFTPQDDLGVRIVSPTTAANAAARRMQQLTGSPWRPASS